MRRLLLKLPLVAGAALGLPSVASAQSRTLSFVVIINTSVEETRAAWDPFFADLRQATQLEVHGFYPPSYAAAIDALLSNQAHLAWLSSKAALDCIERANLEVFGQLTDGNGALGYRSIIVTRRDSGISSMDQLLSKPRTYGFAMSESASTSGHAVPSYALFVPRGIQPQKHFAPLLYGNHARTLDAVLKGEVHAGTYNTRELQRLRATQSSRAAVIRVLWESTLIPPDPLLWRKDLRLSVRSKLAAFFFSYGKTPREKARLKQMDLTGFRPSSNQQLRFVLELEDFRMRSEILLDPRLGEAQKNERLADLRDRYGRLSRALLPAASPGP